MLQNLQHFSIWFLFVGSICCAKFHLPSNGKDENEWRPIVPIAKQKISKKNVYDVSSNFNKIEYRYKPVENAKINHHGSTGYNMVHPIPNDTAISEINAKESSSYVYRSAINKPSQYHQQQHQKPILDYNKNVKQPLTSSSIRQEYFDSLPIYHGHSSLYDEHKAANQYFKNLPHSSYVYVDHVLPYTTVTNHEYDVQNYNKYHKQQQYVNNKPIFQHYYSSPSYFERDSTRHFLPIKTSRVPPYVSAITSPIPETTKISHRKIVPENILVQLPPPIISSPHVKHPQYHRDYKYSTIIPVLINSQNNGYEVTEKQWNEDNYHLVSNPFNFVYENKLLPTSTYAPNDIHIQNQKSISGTVTPKYIFEVTESPQNNVIEISTINILKDDKINVYKEISTTERPQIVYNNNGDLNIGSTTTSRSSAQRVYIRPKLSSRKRKPNLTHQPSPSPTPEPTTTTTSTTEAHEDYYPKENYYTENPVVVNDIKKINDNTNDQYDNQVFRIPAKRRKLYKKKTSTTTTTTTMEPKTTATINTELPVENYDLTSYGQVYGDINKVAEIETNSNEVLIEATEGLKSANHQNTVASVEDVNSSSSNEELTTSSENYPPMHIIKRIKAQRNELTSSPTFATSTFTVVTTDIPVQTTETVKSTVVTKRKRTRPRFSLKDFKKKTTNSSDSSTTSLPTVSSTTTRRKFYPKRTKTGQLNPNEQKNNTNTEGEKPTRNRFSNKRRTTTTAAAITSSSSGSGSSETESIPTTFKGTDRTNMLNGVKGGTFVKIKERILKKNQATTKSQVTSNSKSDVEAETEDLSGENSDHMYSTIRDLADENDKGELSDSEEEISDKNNNAAVADDFAPDTEIETESKERSDITFDVDTFLQSQMVSNLTLASPYHNYKSAIQQHQSRKVPQHFTLATNDPILPIEAFFPQIYPNKSTNV